MNVYDVRTAPDYTTLTIGWAEYYRLLGEGAARDEPADVTADRVWEMFAGGVGTYVENTPIRERPLPYYPTVFAVPLYGFTVAWGGEKQGLMVQLSGAWWNLVGDQQSLRSARRNGWRCTRWDEALTLLVYAPHSRPAWDIAQHYMKLPTEKPEKDISWHHPHMQHGAETYYRGSRKSGRFARVYDKPELDYRDLQVVRVEVEYKRQWANPMLDAWLDTHHIDLRLMAAFLMGDCTGDDHPSIAFALNSAPNHPSPKPTPQPLAKRPKWFHDQIAKAFMNWADEDALGAISWAMRMIEEVAPQWRLVTLDEMVEAAELYKRKRGK